MGALSSLLATKVGILTIWVRSRNCGCLVTWFSYQLIAKPGNKTATVSWPDPYAVPPLMTKFTPCWLSVFSFFTSLTCLPWTKWPPFRRRYLQMHFREWKVYCILIKFSLKFVPKCLIDNNPALVQIMAWRRIGDKPLSEPMLTWSTEAYMRH